MKIEESTRRRHLRERLLGALIGLGRENYTNLIVEEQRYIHYFKNSSYSIYTLNRER